MAAILADDIFNCIFLNENDRIPIQISLEYVLRSPIEVKPALVQVMAWRRTGERQPSSLTHIYAALGGDKLLAQGCCA